MKKNLLALLACFCTLFAWAEGDIVKQYTLDKANGNLYRGESANQNWNSIWKSNAQPELTFGCGPNNMNWVDNNIQMMTGTAASATYTLTAPSGMCITDYSFTFANNGHSTGLSLTMADGTAYTTKTEAQTISASGVELQTVSFTLAGANGNGVLLTDFTVTAKGSANAELASTTVVQGKVTTGIGNKDQGMVRSKIVISGSGGSVNFQGVKIRVAGTIGGNDITAIKAYFAKNQQELFVDADNAMPWREENGELFGTPVEYNMDTKEYTISGSKDLAPGEYYLWIAYDISENAKEGNKVDARILNYIIDGEEVAEPNGNPKLNATIFLTESAVLMPMDKGSLYYRIPSITVSADGKRLVTLTDDRKNHNTDLPSHCYLVAQYSEDGGKTWSDPQTVAGTATTGGNYGHGDASIVTNRDNGEIVGIMTSAGTYGHGFFAGTAAQPPRWKTITSRDGGLTWDAPVDHTDDLFGAKCSNPKTKTWQSGFSGSGAALQRRNGILVSSFVNRQADNSQHFYFFMSKDGGKSWYVSGNSGTSGADEPKTLERNNGDLAISVRATGFNISNCTSDEGKTWHKPAGTRFRSGISGNACDGEYNRRGRDIRIYQGDLSSWLCI